MLVYPSCLRNISAVLRCLPDLIFHSLQVFNGGSDFNEPVKRCLERLTDAKWANSDILLVSGGGSRVQGAPDMTMYLNQCM